MQHHFSRKPLAPMRISLLATFLLFTLLAACSTKGEIPPSKNISQGGPLKVHPGLLGKPVPAELQQETPATQPPSAPNAEPKIKMDPVGLRTQRSVYFELNSAAIKADYDPVLRAHARYLADHPKSRVRIEGNADERGSNEHNRNLAQKRAENVRVAMLVNGAAEKQVSIKSLGASNPKLTGHDEASWAENRRSDVVYEREE